MYKYILPLLEINSEIEFKFENYFNDQCAALEKNATNIYIKKGKVDYENYNAIREKYISDNFIVLFDNESIILNLNKNSILVYIKDKTVIVEYDYSHRNVVFDNLLELIIPYFYLKMECLVLHAASCRYNGKTILFSADSGAGKTTLLLSLLRLGAEYISDDLVCILKNGNQYLCVGIDFTLPKANANTIRMLEIADNNIIRASGINAKSYISIANKRKMFFITDSVVFLNPVSDKKGIRLRKTIDPAKKLLEQTVGMWGLLEIDLIKLLGKWQSFSDIVNVYTMEYTKDCTFLEEVASHLSF